jgi:hypothetical protein
MSLVHISSKSEPKLSDIKKTLKEVLQDGNGEFEKVILLNNKYTRVTI